MAIRAVVLVTQVNFDSSTDVAGEFSVNVNYISDSGLNIGLTINKVAMNNLTNVLFVAAIKNAVKTNLINVYGYTFGLLDTVYIMNSNIL